MKTTSLISLVLLTALGLALGGQPGAPAWAGPDPQDAALFYDELAPHGTWIEDQQHGPLWYPHTGKKNWRPYVDGRWRPTQQGYMFETKEPWGWATYHYGNWMPHQQHGWVWSPGRTWYPHTVAWRQNDQHVGWAPIPPQSYGGSGGSPEGYGGQLDSPFWTFIQAAQFLLGFGQSYTPDYSYYNNPGYFPSSSELPVIYQQSQALTNVVAPSYAPEACYVWGPPVPYISRVTNINRTDITNYIDQTNISRIHNSVAPLVVRQRRPYFREVMPPMDRFQAATVRPARSWRPGLHLNRPDVTPRPAQLPPLPERLAHARHPGPQGDASRGHHREVQPPPQSSWQWQRPEPGGQQRVDMTHRGPEGNHRGPVTAAVMPAPGNNSPSPWRQQRPERSDGRREGYRYSNTSPGVRVDMGRPAPPVTGQPAAPEARGAQQPSGHPIASRPPGATMSSPPVGSRQQSAPVEMRPPSREGYRPGPGYQQGREPRQFSRPMPAGPTPEVMPPAAPRPEMAPQPPQVSRPLMPPRQAAPAMSRPSAPPVASQPRPQMQPRPASPPPQVNRQPAPPTRAAAPPVQVQPRPAAPPQPVMSRPAPAPAAPAPAAPVRQHPGKQRGQQQV